AAPPPHRHATRGDPPDRSVTEPVSVDDQGGTVMIKGDDPPETVLMVGRLRGRLRPTDPLCSRGSRPVRGRAPNRRRSPDCYRLCASVKAHFARPLQDRPLPRFAGTPSPLASLRGTKQ